LVPFSCSTTLSPLRRAPHSFPTRRSSDLAAVDQLRLRAEMIEQSALGDPGLRRHGVERRTSRSALIEQNVERVEQLLFGLRRIRSEEHTSELQSRFDLVCRLLLEKKK